MPHDFAKAVRTLAGYAKNSQSPVMRLRIRVALQDLRRGLEREMKPGHRDPAERAIIHAAVDVITDAIGDGADRKPPHRAA